MNLLNLENKMKKLLAILPLLILSCQKNETVSETTTTNDSAIVLDQSIIDYEMDSAANGFVTIDENKAVKKSSKTFRVIAGDSIIKTINGDMIPLKISDEFTSDQQQYILKIKNFTGKKISGKITPENSDMNIRFNQIKLANGSFDGPFGLEMKMDINESGEIWLLIGKSLMASGKSKGKFSVEIK